MFLPILGIGDFFLCFEYSVEFPFILMKINDDLFAVSAFVRMTEKIGCNMSQQFLS